MGMIGHVRQVTLEQLRELQQNPDTLEQFLHGKILASAPKIRAALERVQQLGMQARAESDPEKRELLRQQVLQELETAGVQPPSGGPGEDGLSLEKSWHSLHYLLTGSAEPVGSPLGKAILGGREIGPDLGYGPARFLDVSEVREVAANLSKLSPSDLARRFDLPTMMAVRIYACRDEGELELAQHYFAQLKDYYSDAEKRGNAMLLYID